MRKARASTRTRAKAITLRPQSKYPVTMMGLRTPSLSDRAPTARVVTGATTALAETMAAIIPVSPVMVL